MHRLLLVWAALIFCGCQPKSAEDAALNELEDNFRAANQAASIEPMLALYELEGSAPQTVQMLRNALLFEQGMPIRSIDFQPLTGAPEEKIHFIHGGIEYGPTLEPRLRMRVRYETEDRFESRFTIGLNSDGEWRIISSRPIN